MRTPRRVKKMFLRSLLHYVRHRGDPVFRLSRVEARLLQRWFRRQGIYRITARKVAPTAVGVWYWQR